jgi:hypothetical protein
LALMVVAGGLAYLAGQGVFPWPGRAPVPNGREALWDAIIKIDAPLVTESAGNGPRYRIGFDRAKDAFYLDEDRDGDGRFERPRRYFQRGPN